MFFSIYNIAIAALLVPFTLASFIPNRGLNIVKTVTLPNGQIIDWIAIESQTSDEIASPPPHPPTGHDLTPVAEFNVLRNVHSGPRGTVPIARKSGNMPPKKPPPPPHGRESIKPPSRITRRQYAGRHWYATTGQKVSSLATSGTLSMYRAYVQSSNDFSLLQGAVVRNGVPGVGGSGLQTLEAGWINFPSEQKNPHLFIFFTVNGHTQYQDYLQSWNLDYKGFIQIDTTYYPGMELTPLSVVGGVQRDLSIQYYKYQSNWWLGVNGKWVGYYPAKLFTRNGNSPDITLESKSDQLSWYGEVYQSEQGLTTTDMGSGNFANKGRSKAAYIKNIQYLANNKAYNYDGSQGMGVDDPKRYTLETHFNSGEEWGSYIYLGGPGAGGVVGG